MAQRQDQLDRGALTGRAERAWARLTGVTLGYGYQPWRALLGLLAVTMIAVVLVVTLGAHGGIARVDPHPPAATQCSAVERVGVGLDLGLPLIKTGTRDHCDTTASTTGQVLTAAGWGPAAAGLGLRHPVRRRLHRRRPQDLTDPTRPASRLPVDPAIPTDAILSRPLTRTCRVTCRVTTCCRAGRLPV